ncbi:MAG TPA: hypothetical protein PK156_45795 [Polyangium sp.]|nr:hypothetical protein [Polyangium sp.]
MKTMKWGALVGFAFVVMGCDAAKEPMAKAREAEAAGKLADAKTLYADVCKANEKSPFCSVAKQHAAALAVRESMATIAEGNYAKAKEQGAAATDGPAKRAYEALAKTKAMTVWATFEEANAGADKAAARAKMVELAQASSPVADKAKEWLAKNGPALLLAEIKSACKADGTGSCSDLGKQMAKTYPSAPEATEAQTLVDAEYKRLFPVLKQAEGLIVQRLEVYNWQAKRDLCMKFVDSNAESEVQACGEAIGIPTDRGDPFNTDFLEKAWKKKLDEVHDPGLIKSLEDRWSKVASTGIYDPANLPKPGDKPAAQK